MRRGLGVIGCLLALGAHGATYSVGPARTYSSPCVLFATVTLQPGDVVQVDVATYTDACQVHASGTAQSPIVLTGGAPGTAMPLFNPPTTLDLSGAGSVPRAIFQFTGASYWAVHHLELEHATSATSGNAAAFRATAGSHDILIDDVSIHDCQDGVMSDGVATVTIQNSELFHNGIGDGFTHNLYMQGDTTVLIGNHIHDSNGGQNVKLRSPYAVLLYNRIENAGNYEIDLIQSSPATDAPNSNAVMIGNLVIRPATSGNNSQVILFGSDGSGGASRNGSLYAVNNTFVMANPSNRLFHANAPVAGSQIFLVNNLVTATVGGTGLASDATTAGVLTGRDNWINVNVVTAGALTGTLTGGAPGFAGAGDYHLAATSPARDHGAPDPTYVDHAGAMQGAVPTLELAALSGTLPRPSDCSLDIGAYEFPGDAGCASDGGAPDAGGDGGAVPDSGNSGGPPPHGIPPPAAGTSGGGGCTCGASGFSAALVPLLLLAFTRRRARRSAPLEADRSDGHRLPL